MRYKHNQLLFSQPANLEIAKQAISHVKRNLSYGANNKPAEEAQLSENKKELYRQDQGLNLAQILIDDLNKKEIKDLDNAQIKIRQSLIEAYPYMKGFIEAAAKSGAQYEAGNCLLQAAMAFEYLKEKGIRPIEIYKMVDGDHAFVVVGRPITSNPRDPSSWGSAFICDPWANEIYPAREFLFGFNSTDPVKNRKYPLQTKGFPDLVYRLDTGDREISNIAHTFNTQFSKTYTMVKLISELQLKLNLNPKEFRYLEGLKAQLIIMAQQEELAIEQGQYKSNDLQKLFEFISSSISNSELEFSQFLTDLSILVEKEEFRAKMGQLIDIITEAEEDTSSLPLQQASMLEALKDSLKSAEKTDLNAIHAQILKCIEISEPAHFPSSIIDALQEMKEIVEEDMNDSSLSAVKPPC
ncbi:TPA: hypothetical protein ACPSKY_001091 [Legionella bozemanae]